MCVVQQPNKGYHSEKIPVSLRSDWVERIDSMVNNHSIYRSRQDVIRTALGLFLGVRYSR